MVRESGLIIHPSRRTSTPGSFNAQPPAPASWTKSRRLRLGVKRRSGAATKARSIRLHSFVRFPRTCVPLACQCFVFAAACSLYRQEKCVGRVGFRRIVQAAVRKSTGKPVAPYAFRYPARGCKQMDKCEPKDNILHSSRTMRIRPPLHEAGPRSRVQHIYGVPKYSSTMAGVRPVPSKAASNSTRASMSES
jgi:hypothetical protein